MLLFPFGLRLGLLLQSPGHYWPPLLLCEGLLLYWLNLEVGLPHWPWLVAGSLLTLLPLLIARRQQVRNDWQQLLLLLGHRHGSGAAASPGSGIWRGKMAFRPCCSASPAG